MAEPFNLRDFLEQFYGHHNPEKLAVPGFLDRVTAQYEGHELTLLRQLRNKYGQLPPGIVAPPLSPVRGVLAKSTD